MAVALPYRFDNSDVVKIVLRGVLGLLLLVVVPGIPFLLVVRHDYAGAGLLLVIGGIAAAFGWIVAKFLASSRGTIMADAVVVEPGTLYGIPLPGPAGRFPIRQFSAVRVERITTSTNVRVGPHERVRLVGKDDTPDILIARTQRDAGREVGRDFAAVLGLPYEESFPPY